MHLDFYYHEVPHVTRAFAHAAGCDFAANLPFHTKFDGLHGFACNQPHGRCAGTAVVQCVGKWGHTWPLHRAHPHAYADLVFSFFRAHPRARPVGSNWTHASAMDAAGTRLLPLNLSSFEHAPRGKSGSSVSARARARGAS